MRPLKVGLIFVAVSLSGCINVPAYRAKAHEDRLVAIDGQCRSYGFVPGSSKYARCVQDNDQDQNQRVQAEHNAAVAAGRAAGTEYSKESGQPAPPPVGIECKTMQDGQYSCSGQWH